MAPKFGDDTNSFCVDTDSGVKEVSNDNRQAILDNYSCNAVTESSEAVPDNTEEQNNTNPTEEQNDSGSADDSLSMTVYMDYSSSELIIGFNQPIDAISDLGSIQILDASGADKTIWQSGLIGSPDGIEQTFRYSMGSPFSNIYENPCFIGDTDHPYDPEIGERNGPYQAVFGNITGVRSGFTNSISATIDFNCGQYYSLYP